LGLGFANAACALTFGVAIAACSIARPLVPLRVGALAAELSVPGVLAGSDKYSFPVGLPLVGVRYGVAPDRELRLRLHAAPLLTNGIIGLEGGGVAHLTTARGLSPAVHVTSDLSFFANPRFYGGPVAEVVRGALDLSAIAHWQPCTWLWPYVVVDQAFVVYERRYVASVFAGAQLRLGERWELSLESGVADVAHHSRDWTEPYIGVLGRGAVWLSWGIAYRFDAWSKPEREEAAL